MAGFFLEMFGISLGLTLAVELPICWALGLRRRRGVLLAVLVNILTNPAAVLLCWLGMSRLLVELGVILLEALVYRWFSKNGNWNIPHPVRLSALANSASWLLGIWIGGA